MQAIGEAGHSGETDLSRVSGCGSIEHSVSDHCRGMRKLFTYCLSSMVAKA